MITALPDTEGGRGRLGTSTAVVYYRFVHHFCSGISQFYTHHLAELRSPASLEKQREIKTKEAVQQQFQNHKHLPIKRQAPNGMEWDDSDYRFHIPCGKMREMCLSTWRGKWIPAVIIKRDHSSNAAIVQENQWYLNYLFGLYQ